MKLGGIAIVVMIGLAAGLAGCRAEFSSSFEPFSKNKLAALGRGMESTRDAQRTACDEVTSAVQTIKLEAWTGAEPAAAYELARRLDAICESRERTAHTRLKTLEFNGEEYFRQWAKENAEYQDSSLRAASRQNRQKVQASFDSALGALKRADEAAQPALEAIRDQVLFLKHHRNSPTVPERPAGSRDPSGPAEALAEHTEVAARAATEFAASVRATPK